jgi:hypothetical protein
MPADVAADTVYREVASAVAPEWRLFLASSHLVWLTRRLVDWNWDCTDWASLSNSNSRFTIHPPPQHYGLLRYLGVLKMEGAVERLLDHF